MTQIVTQLLLQSIIIYMRQCYSAVLPRWVYRVPSCPNPRNYSQWIEASKRLNCYHRLDSTDVTEQAMVYHCLPSTFLNETVEFCGTNVPVSPGNCPIYNYRQQHVSNYPTYYNCSKFTSGCPTKMFHSKKVFMYPYCLKINRISKCFEAQIDCPDTLNSPNSKVTTEITPTHQITTMSTSSYEDSKTSDSVNVSEMKDNDNERYIYIAVSLFVLVTVALMILLFLLRRKISLILHKYLSISSPSQFISDEDMESLEQGQARRVTESSPEILKDKANGHAANCEGAEAFPLLENMYKGARNWRYNDLLRALEKHMTTKVFNRIKYCLKDREEENISNDLDEIKEPMELLEYLDKKYLVYNNIVFLQGLFLECKVPILYDQCVEYAKSRGEEICFFEKKILQSDHTKVKYIVNCPKMPDYKRTELEKLRVMLATLLHAHYDDILVSGVKNGCVIVTFMLRNCLVPTLKTLYTSEKISMTCQWMLKLSLKYKVMKVMIKEEVIYMSDLLLPVDRLTAEAKLSGDILHSSLNSDQQSLKMSKKKSGFGRCIPEALEYKEPFSTENEPKKDMSICKTHPSDLQKFRTFLETTGSCITDDTLQDVKTILRGFMDQDFVGVDTTTMLNQLSNTFKLQYNMNFLEWIFDKCGECDIVKKCKAFSEENQLKLECFDTNYTPRGDSQHLKFQFMVFELDSYSAEVQDLRYWLAKTIEVHPGQILMTALESGPIVVTFLMRVKHAKALLRYLQTDDGQIAASRKRVEKIIHNGKTIAIGKAINGSTFINIRLRLGRNCYERIEDRVRNVATRVLGRTATSVDGKEIYMRTFPSVPTKTDNRDESSSHESFIEKNHSSLLENLEPSSVTKADIASLFNEDEMMKMLNIEGRRNRAERFLEMCKGLQREELDEVCSYLEKHFCLPKEISTNEELGPVRNWIHDHKDNLLDEIDSDFIETAINYMEDVPEEVKKMWSDRSKERKKRAMVFLDFVLQKDEYVKVLQKTIEENGIQFQE